MKHYLIKDHFYPEADKLRKVFDDRFANPKEASPERFMWDYWYVPDQYQLVRTPAYHYFPEKIYNRFHAHLVQWGRENLGCHDISPTWLSYYVDGCHQQLHADVPHGPWAFVFSLTPKKRQFKGGETLILRPTVLNYWQNFIESKERELSSFVERIPSNYNRLTVFDPRFPHGVTEVEGTHDPREARLVLHGWFVEPRPYVQGPLSTAQVHKVLETAIYRIEEAMPQMGDIHGTLSLRLDIQTSGMVKALHLLTNTVVGLDDDYRQRRYLGKLLIDIFKGLQFPRATKESKIVVPLLFK